MEPSYSRESNGRLLPMLTSAFPSITQGEAICHGKGANVKHQTPSACYRFAASSGAFKVDKERVARGVRVSCVTCILLLRKKRVRASSMLQDTHHGLHAQ